MDKKSLLFKYEDSQYKLQEIEGRLHLSKIFKSGVEEWLYELVYEKGKVKAIGPKEDGEIVEHEICQLFDVPQDNWITFFLFMEESHPHPEGLLHAYNEMYHKEVEDYKKKYEELCARLRAHGLSGYIF